MEIFTKETLNYKKYNKINNKISLKKNINLLGKLCKLYCMNFV